VFRSAWMSVLKLKAADFRFPLGPRLTRMAVFVSLFYPATSFAFVSQIGSYLNQYQVGIDYANSIDRVNVSYDTSSAGGEPKSCGILSSDPSKMRCEVGMVGGSSNGWGVFLQPAFKKQGFFYLNWDVSFGARYLSGALPKAEQSLSGLPMRKASFSLGAVVMKPYVQFGITPDRWPDILISMGPAVQAAAGTVSINDKAERVMVGTSSLSGPMSVIHGFFALELVVRRFGEGAFSFILSRDVTGSGRGTKIYPKSIDGMSNFRGAFSRKVGGMAYGFGLKLVTPWP
jgi:hypothetical protein